jgi:hypothetical protein
VVTTAALDRPPYRIVLLDRGLFAAHIALPVCKGNEMIVLVAGMPRSGSTFSFNVIREILQRRGRVYYEACEEVLGPLHRSNGAEHVVIKGHNFDAPALELARAGAVHVIMTVRRMEDAMASLFEIFDTLTEEAALQTMRDWLKLYQQLRSYSKVVSYEEIDRHPWLAAWHIARAVCPSVRPTEVIRIARRFRKAEIKRQADQLILDTPGIVDRSFSYYESTTFVHRRHISRLRSRPAEERLDADRLARVRTALACDMRAAGMAP